MATEPHTCGRIPIWNPPVGFIPPQHNSPIPYKASEKIYRRNTFYTRQGLKLKIFSYFYDIGVVCGDISRDTDMAAHPNRRNTANQKPYIL